MICNAWLYFDMSMFLKRHYYLAVWLRQPVRFFLALKIYMHYFVFPIFLIWASYMMMAMSVHDDGYSPYMTIALSVHDDGYSPYMTMALNVHDDGFERTWWWLFPVQNDGFERTWWWLFHVYNDGYSQYMMVAIPRTWWWLFPVHDDGYSRNASCVVNLISVILLFNFTV